MVNEMVTTQIDLPKDLLDAVQRTASQDGRDQADVVRDAIREYLRARTSADSERGALPEPGPAFSYSLGAGDDPDLDSRDIDEWLDAHWRPA
jgi:Arc/MetJ-type ribon-helix-helix transcriptional regulator